MCVRFGEFIIDARMFNDESASADLVTSRYVINANRVRFIVAIGARRRISIIRACGIPRLHDVKEHDGKEDRDPFHCSPHTRLEFAVHILTGFPPTRMAKPTTVRSAFGSDLISKLHAIFENGPRWICGCAEPSRFPELVPRRRSGRAIAPLSNVAYRRDLGRALDADLLARALGPFFSIFLLDLCAALPALGLDASTAATTAVATLAN